MADQNEPPLAGVPQLHAPLLLLEASAPQLHGEAAGSPRHLGRQRGVPPSALPLPPLLSSPRPSPPPPLPPSPPPLSDLPPELLALVCEACDPAACAQLRLACKACRVAARMISLPAWLSRHPTHTATILHRTPDVRLVAVAEGIVRKHWALLQQADGPRPVSAAVVVAAVLAVGRLSVYLFTPALRAVLQPLPDGGESFSVTQQTQLLMCAARHAVHAAGRDATAGQQLLQSHLQHMPLLRSCVGTPRGAALAVGLVARTRAPLTATPTAKEARMQALFRRAADLVVALLHSVPTCVASLLACLRCTGVTDVEAAISAAAPPDAIPPLWARVWRDVGHAAARVVAATLWRDALLVGASAAALLAMHGCVQGGAAFVLGVEGPRIAVDLALGGRGLAQLRRVIQLLARAGVQSKLAAAAAQMPDALYARSHPALVDGMTSAGVREGVTVLLAACPPGTLHRQAVTGLLKQACSRHDVPMIQAMLAELPSELTPPDTHGLHAAMSAIFDKVHQDDVQAGPSSSLTGASSEPLQLRLLAMLTAGRRADKDCAVSLQDITAWVKAAALGRLVRCLLSPGAPPPPPPSSSRSSSAGLLHTLLSELSQHSSAVVVRNALEVVLWSTDQRYTSLLLRPLCAALSADGAEELLLGELLRVVPRPAVVAKLASCVSGGGIASALLAALGVAAPAPGPEGLDLAAMPAGQTSRIVSVVLGRIKAARPVGDAPTAHHVRLLKLLEREPDMSVGEAAAVHDMLMQHL